MIILKIIIAKAANISNYGNANKGYLEISLARGVARENNKEHSKQMELNTDQK